MAHAIEFPLKLDTELESFRKIKGRCFTDEEYEKRWNSFTSLLSKQQLDALIVYGADRAGSAIPWLTGWSVSAEPVLIISLDTKAKLYIQYYNHTPQATATAYGASVSWAGPDTLQSILYHLSKIKSQSIVFMRKLGFI